MCLSLSKPVACFFFSFCTRSFQENVHISPVCSFEENVKFLTTPANDADFCAISQEEEWGLPKLCCCKKRIHMQCLESHLGDGRHCPHCQHSLLELLLARVDWRFRDFYRMMFTIHINDGGHVQPRLKHKWNFLEPWGGQWSPKWFFLWMGHSMTLCDMFISSKSK